MGDCTALRKEEEQLIEVPKTCLCQSSEQILFNMKQKVKNHLIGHL